jgi:hypothetical protein
MGGIARDYRSKLQGIHMNDMTNKSIDELWSDFACGDIEAGFGWALHPDLMNRSDRMENFITRARDSHGVLKALLSAAIPHILELNEIRQNIRETTTTYHEKDGETSMCLTQIMSDISAADGLINKINNTLGFKNEEEI